MMYGSGPGMVDLHGARVDPVGSNIDLSLLQRQSAPQKKHGSMTDSSISLLGILGPGARRLCMSIDRLSIWYETSAACAFFCYI